MTSIQTIENNCRDLAELRGKLRKKFEARQKAVLAATAEFDDDIRFIQNQCGMIRDELLTHINGSRDLFTKRKTQTFCGITVGFKKSRDKVTGPPDEILVERIETMLPAAQGKTLLDKTVSIIKGAFNKLPQETLQKLGCSRASGADNAIVLAEDDDIEKLVTQALGVAGPVEEVNG